MVALLIVLVDQLPIGAQLVGVPGPHHQTLGLPRRDELPQVPEVRIRVDASGIGSGEDPAASLYPLGTWLLGTGQLGPGFNTGPSVGVCTSQADP